VVFFGANDATSKDLNTLQHVPIEEYAQNLRDILEMVVATGVAKEKIILVTPPAMNEEMWGNHCMVSPLLCDTPQAS